MYKLKEKVAIHNLIKIFPQLSFLQQELGNAANTIIEAFRNGRKILICGNGGSSADADHFAGELMKSFEIPRPLPLAIKKKLEKVSNETGKLLAENLQQGIPAFSLSSNPALITAISNDTGAAFIFAQQVVAYGKAGDVLIGFSTSGNSENVVNAMVAARAFGVKTIGFTGETGGNIKQFSDILINVPETKTAFIQELHLPIYHAICRQVELEIYG